MGLFEVLELDDQIRRLIISGEPSAVLRDHALEHGLMKTLRSDGVRKVISGITSVSEVIRVTSVDEN
jgi:type II secretory ATPase GspE/PulE/Tfp pilus assembly ATPase PilB-like protein